MIVGLQTNSTGGTGIGKLNIQNTKVQNGKKKAEQSAADAFAGLMNLTSQKIDEKESFVKPAVTEKNTDFDAVSGTKTDSPSKVERTDYAKRDKMDSPDKSTVNSSYSEHNDVKNVVNDTEATNKDEVAADDTDVETVIQVLSDKLMELLNIDDEQLQQLLQDSGLEMIELLNPETLQQFILQVNHATSVDLLIDEDLHDMVNQLLQTLESALAEQEVLHEEPVSFGEEIPAWTDNAETNTQKAAVQTTPEAVDTEQQPDYDTDVSDVKNREQQNIQEIKVTVQTESGQHNGSQDGQLQQNTDSIFENLNQAFAQAVGNETMESTEYFGKISRADVLRQVVDEIKMSMSKDVNSLTVSLNPEQLGKVHIHVVAKNGMMQAQIIAENEAAKNAVEAGISTLKEAFENQDLKVDAIEVMVGTQDYFADSQGNAQEEMQNRNKENGSASINLNDISDDELNESEKIEAEMMKMTGSRVNYMA